MGFATGHFHYLTFGQRVCSTMPLPGFQTSDFNDGTNVAVRLANYSDSKLDADCGPLLERLTTNLDCGLLVYEHTEGFLLRFEGMCDFVVWSNGLIIEVRPFARVGESWVQSMICGTLMAFALHLQGVGNLHASSVETPDGAIAFLGDPGAGKSTMAAAFAEWGHPVISDDVLVVDCELGKYFTQPGVSHLTLSRDSMNTVGRGNMDTDDLVSVGEKLRLPIDGSWASFVANPIPLKAMFLLSRGAEDTEVSIEKLTPSEATMQAMVNTLCLPILPPGAVRQYLSFSAGLTSSVPVLKLHYGEGRANLARVRAAVLDAVQIS